MIDRRTLIATALLPALAPAIRARESQSEEGTRLTAIYEKLYDRLLETDPEFCTALGLDKGAYAGAKSKLTDRSPAGIRRQHDLYREGLKRLATIDPSKLSGMDLVNYETFHGPWQSFVKAYDTFSYGLHSWPEPHPVTQLSGIYRSIPDFLTNQHSIANAADAEAYLARCRDFAKQLDNETGRIQTDHVAGVIPPDFVIDRTLEVYARVAAPAPEANILVTNLTRKTKAIPGDWATRCAKIVSGDIYPAMQRQIAELRRVRPRATHDAGVWRLPQGADYYDYALRYATTTGMKPQEVHQLGLEKMADLTARADAILRAQGMTEGSVAQRLRALGKDPRFIYPNTDAGKAKLIAELNAQIVEIQRRLPEMFGRLPKTLVEIRRVPPEIEAGATAGYYQIPSADGSRPGAYYINLRDTAENPRWMLPTLTYHEATPGHHHQIALAQEAAGIPRLRRLPVYSVYTEGWGLYAEQLADEMGAYADDPFGRLGYLQSYMFRAARLVVDTGLHHMRWSREKAIQYMNDALGTPERGNITEVERYCVWPGQATSYMVGQTRWVAIREKAHKALGDKFDIRAFHDTALAAGAMPVSVLESMIDRWVAAQRGG
ncbi:DUF885 domain-containing protein [Sphingomonas koreensis]|uniref:DUF885 domain-containing protein n=1 Tax=Sphingomonas koreensis TaxID=93064 RepID=UPI000F7E9F94|nr:DUF885 family protein [Sphingomonas koreensis]RSU36070.1 DUF885 domain-containing protein [Sphingomonas koreensis]RSV62273.1 DUF885 family protein [Sphingomonas koreensis]RSY21410.1 DUF885 family protein [Sphingomonas koreensis]